MNEMTPGASIALQLRQIVIALPCDWELVGRAADYIEELEAELTQSEKWRIGMTAALVEVMTIMGDDMTHPPTVITPEDMIRLAKEWRKDYDEALAEGL